MKSLALIERENKQAAREASRKGKKPYVIFEAAEIETMPPFPFPMIGDLRPKGWTLKDTLFVDASGFGADNEAALSVSQLLAKLRELYAENSSFGYALIEVGQFQAYLGVFERTRV